MTNRPDERRPYPPHLPPLSVADHYMGPSSSSSVAFLKGCCCCLFLLLIFLSLLVVAITLVIVLVVRPKKPEFDLQRVGVKYLLVAPTDSSGDGVTLYLPSLEAYLSLNTKLLFTAVNPNKVGIKYGAADLYVLYHDVPLGIVDVPEFEQSEEMVGFSGEVATVYR